MKGLQKRNPHLPDTAKQGKKDQSLGNIMLIENYPHREKEMLTKFCQIWGTVLLSMTLLSEYKSYFKILSMTLLSEYKSSF